MHGAAMRAHTFQHGVLAHQRDGFEFVPILVQGSQLAEGDDTQQYHQQHDAAEPRMQPGLHLHLIEHGISSSMPL
jgi:hypothetical protein